jgi:ribonuclease P/MRP protein subunit RPP1
VQSCKIPHIDLGPDAAADAISTTDLSVALAASSAKPKAGTKRRRESAPSSTSSSSSSSAARAPFLQLSRVTVAIDGPRAVSDFCAAAASGILSSYDLVSISPSTSDALHSLLATGHVDVVDLDLAGGKPPFPLSKHDVDAVLRAGCVFEASYAPAIRDPTCRRFFVSNLASLLRLSRGKGVLLTSAARAAAELRTPADAAAVAAMAGMTAQQCEAATVAAAATAVAHAERRLGGRGGAVAHVLPGPPAATAGAGATSSSSSSSSSSQSKQSTQAGMLAAHSKELGVGGGESGAGGGSGGGGGGPIAAAPAAFPRPWLASLGARGVRMGGVSAQGWVLAAPPQAPAPGAGGKGRG